MGEPGRALFLDRDGTVIDDVGYIADPSDVRVLDGVIEGLREVDERGYALVIVSNQSGVGRGMMSADDVQAVDDRMRALLEESGVRLAGSYYCPHHPDDGCRCRKPEPGMLLDASGDLGIDLTASWMIGDRASDVAAGLAAGCRSAALGFDFGRGVPTVRDLVELAGLLP